MEESADRLSIFFATPASAMPVNACLRNLNPTKVLPAVQVYDDSDNIGALIIRIGFRGILYPNFIKEPPKAYSNYYGSYITCPVSIVCLHLGINFTSRNPVDLLLLCRTLALSLCQITKKKKEKEKDPLNHGCVPPCMLSLTP